MIYTPTCQHALRALTHLAGRPDRRPALVRDIAEAEDVPHQFLSKILHDLRKKGFVQSKKGPGGGYFLAKPPADILVTDVVHAVDGTADLSKICVLGLDHCTDTDSCALHDLWTRFRDRFVTAMTPLTLHDLARTRARKRAR